MQQLTPDDVQQALNDLNLDIKIHTFETSTATSQLAADAIGCELGQIVKSLCFIINKEQPIIILTSGDQVVDDKKVAALFEVGRKRVKMAKPDECIAIYGYPPGGVPPVGHRTPGLPVYVDASLRRYETLYAAGGTANTIFPIQLDTLVTVTGGSYADVVKD